MHHLRVLRIHLGSLLLRAHWGFHGHGLCASCVLLCNGIVVAELVAAGARAASKPVEPAGTLLLDFLAFNVSLPTVTPVTANGHYCRLIHSAICSVLSLLLRCSHSCLLFHADIAFGAHFLIEFRQATLFIEVHRVAHRVFRRAWVFNAHWSRLNVRCSVICQVDTCKLGVSVAVHSASQLELFVLSCKSLPRCHRRLSGGGLVE